MPEQVVVILGDLGAAEHQKGLREPLLQLPAEMDGPLEVPDRHAEADEIRGLSLQPADDAGVSSWDSTYCLSPEGVILYSDTRNGDTRMIQEATSYKNSVDDSDLVPPAEPKSFTFEGTGA